MLLESQEIEPITYSIVLVWEPHKLNPVSLKDLEAQLGTIDSTDRVMTADGSGAVFRLAKPHIELVLMSNKWEIHARGEDMSPNIAGTVARAVDIFKGYVENPTLKVIGYNYNIVFKTLNDELAVKAIADCSVNVKAVEQRTKHSIKGAAVWLYSDDVAGRKLWLRLEPRGGEADSTKVWAYANLSEEPKEHFPSQEEMKKNFHDLYSTFINLVKSL